jgi:hypothetical protein
VPLPRGWKEGLVRVVEMEMGAVTVMVEVGMEMEAEMAMAGMAMETGGIMETQGMAMLEITTMQQAVGILLYKTQAVWTYVGPKKILLILVWMPGSSRADREIMEREIL